MSIADRIRTRLDDPIDVALNGGPYVEAIRNALALHSEQRIYDHCGHAHTDGEDGTVDVREVGLVCEEGFMYAICGECCTDGGSGYQTEHCCVDHPHPCWPCGTVVALAAGMGIAESTSD